MMAVPTWSSPDVIRESRSPARIFRIAVTRGCCCLLLARFSSAPTRHLPSAGALAYPAASFRSHLHVILALPGLGSGRVPC
jgi:hypothetical protein